MNLSTTCHTTPEGSPEVPKTTLPKKLETDRLWVHQQEVLPNLARTSQPPGTLSERQHPTGMGRRALDVLS